MSIVPLTKCIFCENSTNLNTRLSINLEDNTKVDVLICDEHAEDATIKTARAAYVSRKTQIEAFLEQAKAFGITLAPAHNGIITATGASGSLNIATQATQGNIPVFDNVQPVLMEDEETINSDKLDRAGRKGMVSVGGNVPGFGSIPGHRSHDLDDIRQAIPAEAFKGRAKLEQTHDRAGRAINIQAQRVDGLGSTNVKVKQSMTDHDFQRRFKNMADMTRSDRHQGFAENYDFRECPVCHGSAIVKNLGQEIQCPKCNGSGVI